MNFSNNIQKVISCQRALNVQCDEASVWKFLEDAALTRSH